jgi:hypothetical protein
MLTPKQIEALRLQSLRLVDPVNDFLIRDIARRIMEAGQLTSTAQYQTWLLQQMGVSQRQLKQQLRKLFNLSHREIRQLLTQSAEVGYRYDLKNLPFVQSVPFHQNLVLQNIVRAAVDMAATDFENITQTAGHG